MRHGAQKASVNPGSLCRGQTDRCAGKCCKSNKYRRCIPFSSRFEYGCGASDAGLQRSSRVSMGTVFQVPWTFFDEKKECWPEEGRKILRELGFKTAAMALKEDSVSLDDPVLKEEEKLAVVLGTEGDGLAPQTIAGCDYTAMIPLRYP